MNHRFFNKSKKEQNSILVRLAILALAVIISSIIIAIWSGIYLIAVLTFAITLSIVSPFFDVPSLKNSGKFIYHAPLFLSETPRNGLIKIHGGTLFDYWFVIDRKMNGTQRTNFIVQQYLEGLLALIDHYKHDKEIKIRGTSYIINKRTAEKMGFTVVQTDALQKVIMIYNYVNILISNSLAKNKLSFPNLTKTKTFEASISQLAERRAYITLLNESLKGSVGHSIDAQGKG